MERGKVRYLDRQEKQATRPMYEEAFPEDSKEFIDYYYKWKMKDNAVIVMEGAKGDSSFHVMIHLNPHTVCINGNVRKIPYIVAVAADPRYRRQGKMRQVMCRALQDMARKGIPFTFLLPADPVYYRGQGFVFFPRQDYIDAGGVCFTEESAQGMLRAASLDNLGGAGFAAGAGERAAKAGWRRAGEEDAAEMALFSNRILEKRCAIYIRRDGQYYGRLLRELGTEHGGALLAETHGRIRALLSYSINGSGEAEVRELLLESGATRQEAEQICAGALSEAGYMAGGIIFTASRMMARLTSLEALVPLLRSRRPVIYEADVADPVIEANNGHFCIEIDSGGGRVSRGKKTDACRQADIAELTRELFSDSSVYLNEWV